MCKKILVVCGNGIASSSIMVSVLEDYLKGQDIQNVDVQKASLMDCSAEKFNSFDLVVSSTKINNPKVTTKIIMGVGLLTGIGEDEVFEQIKNEIEN
ncbi:PTS galactitol transporter subunit IIB [Tetragenococcus halophilus subsp. flandriensis]|uniref:PTS galactitol transporter subunit IIB n=1 Tax=Tetragenococcus halophilus TaxID=51669 RepID=UPI0023E9DFD0|nr:PTS galactitol transporter subunit IIB [Tetragenococcus halophilus]GMA07796.1 PTS galactitol transporter subunit IIB [Tetragenococcus halophilus subsp. flandriensis]